MKPLIVLALLMSPSLVGFARPPEYAAVIDATRQRANAPRGRGPFPGSASAGHSADFPIRLVAQYPKSELRADGTGLVDFILTNVGPTTIDLPRCVQPPITSGPVSVMTLWLTSDGLVEHYGIDDVTGERFKIAAVGTSAELFGDPANPATFTFLNPEESLLVHASSRVPLKTGVHAITAHAELLRVDRPPVVRSNRVGWADSESVTARFAASIQP
jgi:hypothetical protein